MTSPNADWAYNWGAGAEGTASGVFVAPKGSTAPTAPTGDWDDAFANAGWLTSDGIVEGHAMDNTPTYAWQGGVLIKNLKSNETRTFKFQCLEENAVVMGLLRPGSTVESAAGITTTHVKSATGTDIRAWGFDMIVGDVHKRIVVPTGEVTAYADITYVNTALTFYEFTVSCYPDADGEFYIELSDAPGVVVTGS